MKLIVAEAILGVTSAVLTLLYAGGFFERFKMKTSACWCARPAAWKVIFKQSASKPAIGRCGEHVSVFRGRDDVLKIKRLKGGDR